jgi:integrase
MVIEPDAPPRVPRYCLHKATRQGVIYIGRQEVYLGPYGTPESLKHYAQMVARWQAGGPDAVIGDRLRGKLPPDLTVVELVARFVAWAKGRYVNSPKELSAFAVATRRLLRLHDDTPVRDFGPLALQAVRSVMVADDLCRNVVNAAVHRVRRIWKWAVRNELIEETLWRALGSVPALAEGEEDVRESDPVQPARWRQVRAVLRHAPEMVRIMAKLQILTGMRPGEVVQLRAMDIEKSNKGWLYRPPKHKTKTRKKHRVIQIGPRARAILEPLLPDDAEAFVFDPGRSLADYNARRAFLTKNVGPRPVAHDPALRQARRRARGALQRRFHAHYTVNAYRTAVRRACERVWPLPAPLARNVKESITSWRARLGPKAWLDVVAWRHEHLLHPHQLRHSFGTRIGNRYGEEQAQVLLGHSRLQTTAIYVQRDICRGRRIIAQVG